MEKNIHDDRLDDYVKKSFEDYEEWPAADMWERVEGALPLAEVPATRQLGLRVSWRRMAVAATILLLLSALVCNHLYYENRIRELAVKHQPPVSEAPEGSPHSPTPPVDRSQYLHDPKKQGNSVVPLSKTNATTQANIPIPQAVVPSQKQHTISTIKSTSPINEAKQPTANFLTNNTTSALLQMSPSNEIATSVHGIASPQNPVAPLASTPDSTATYPLKISNLPPIGLIQASLLAYQHSFTTPVIHPVPAPDEHATRWYVGLQSTPVLLVEKTGPERPAGMRPRLVSTQVNTSFSADYWLKFGRKGSGIWGFESGIGYRTVERNTTHTARFRVMNGRLYSGAQERGYDFDYDLDTYSGSMEVTLRMEQVDPAATLPESEPVRIQVTAREQTSMLRIPLLATATLGKNRLQTVFKAGLLGNVILNRQLDIVARSSENTLLRPGQGSNAYSLRLASSGKIFLGYQLSAGLEYRAAKHFSWVLEPSLAGEFPRKNNAGKQLPSITTIGVNAGVNYWF